MSMIKTGNKWNKPTDILREMEKPVYEMSEEQHAFLCSVIKENSPNKVVEIGVAEGGTTAVIMRALELVSPDAKMFSVDLNEKLYYDTSRQTGYLLEEVKGKLSNYENHRYMLGGYLPEVIDEIGSGIDMVILDTVHCMPGEYLDFLCILPYLKDGAIVLLHDITLGISHLNCKNNICTPTLFGALVGNKIWNYNDSNSDNLAAIVIDENTRANLDSVFAMLFLPWEHKYLPSNTAMKMYEDIIRCNYTSNEYEMFQCALRKQIYSRECEKREEEKQIDRFIAECELDKKNVYIYGNGHFGTLLRNKLEKHGIHIKSFVISDGQLICDERMKDTIYFSDYNCACNDNILIYAIYDKSVLYKLIANNIRILEWPFEYEK